MLHQELEEARRLRELEERRKREEEEKRLRELEEAENYERLLKVSSTQIHCTCSVYSKIVQGTTHTSAQLSMF